MTYNQLTNSSKVTLDDIPKFSYVPMYQNWRPRVKAETQQGLWISIWMSNERSSVDEYNAHGGWGVVLGH